MQGIWPATLTMTLVACAAGAGRVSPAVPAASPTTAEAPATATARAIAQDAEEDDTPSDTVMAFVEDALSGAAHLFEPIACADGDEACVDVEMMRQLCLEDDAAQCLALSTAYHLGEGVRSDWRKSGDAAAAGCFSRARGGVRGDGERDGPGRVR